MDPEDPGTLPQGIVRNTDEIYAALARYRVVPFEALWSCWHVYTNTSRKLVDPTSQRLENFWWHVLGSDRRHLSGRALAKMYEDISTGPTVVPLIGPPRRSEGSSVSPARRQPTVDSLPGSSDARVQGAEEAGGSREQDSSDGITLKDPHSSSSKVSLPPILKKNRGPSASGPRPTARFVSPPASGEDKYEPDDDENSSGGIAVAEREILPPRPPSSPKSASPAKFEKRGTSAGKKYVATTSVSRRRPFLSRRPSSQSSTEGGSGPLFRTAGNPKPFAPISEQTANDPQSRSESSATSGGRPTMSAKAAAKRPGRPSSGRKPAPSESLTRADQRQALVVQQGSAPASSRSHREQTQAPASSRTDRAGHETSPEVPSIEIVPETKGSLAPSRTVNHQSGSGTRSRPWEITSINRTASQGLLASSVTATSKVAVQGQFDFEHPTSAATSAPRDIPDVALVSRPSSSSLFAPTQPSPAPSVPLARSKSHLTLLLAREKERQR